MTIDERLEKLTERHEALAQSLEIVAGMQRENEEKIDRITTQVGQLGFCQGFCVSISPQLLC